MSNAKYTRLPSEAHPLDGSQSNQGAYTDEDVMMNDEYEIPSAPPIPIPARVRTESQTQRAREATNELLAMHDPRFDRPTVAVWKRVALLILVFVLFYVGFHMRKADRESGIRARAYVEYVQEKR